MHTRQAGAWSSQEKESLRLAQDLKELPFSGLDYGFAVGLGEFALGIIEDCSVDFDGSLFDEAADFAFGAKLFGGSE